MVLLENSNPEESTGSYVRIFGSQALGLLITKIHSTSIRAGTELEKIIHDKIKNVGSLDEFLRTDIMPEGSFLATKRQIKKYSEFDSKGIEPDFLIFRRKDNEQRCYVIEIKDGHVFDTKKASKEREILFDFTSRNGSNFPFVFQSYLCGFNADSKKDIYEGMKRKINMNSILTGREFCKMFELDYDKIREVRSTEVRVQKNIDYFIKELLNIREVKDKIRKLMS